MLTDGGKDAAELGNEEADFRRRMSAVLLRLCTEAAAFGVRSLSGQRGVEI